MTRIVTRYLVVDVAGDCRVTKTRPAGKIGEAVYELTLRLPNRPRIAGRLEIEVPDVVADGVVQLTDVVAPNVPLCPEVLGGTEAAGECCTEVLELGWRVAAGKVTEVVWACPTGHGPFTDDDVLWD